MLEYWYIWYIIYEDGKSVERGKYPRSYRSRDGARRRAIQMWGFDPNDDLIPIPGTNRFRKWIVSETKPWGGKY